LISSYTPHPLCRNVEGWQYASLLRTPIYKQTTGRKSTADGRASSSIYQDYQGTFHHRINIYGSYRFRAGDQVYIVIIVGRCNVEKRDEEGGEKLLPLRGGRQG